ncbi:MAG: apolipoprotein N-acyltransferase [Candidatus Endobugula sp.]
MQKFIERYPYLVIALCVASGAVTPLSFAPFNLWPIGLTSIAVFAIASYHTQTPKAAFSYALSFGLGYFGTGASWVYVSIYYFGSTGLPLAILLTSLFISFVAFFFALPFYLLPYCKKSYKLTLGFPLLWVFSEWVRTWAFTGFPWLFMGYSHIDNYLVGWAPIGGVLLISLWAVMSSGIIAAWVTGNGSRNHKIMISSCIVSIWLSGYGLQQLSWTTPLDDNITVGLVQPNIPQNLRWAPDYQETIRERLHKLSEPLWGNDWVIWSEAAIPSPHSRATEFIADTRFLAEQSDTTVISGVLYEKPFDITKGQQYFNSVIAIGASEGIYHKQRLVPFGEYVPLESWLRGAIEFFNLPFSVIVPGQANQQPLKIGEYLLANAICYEIAYPALVAQQAVNSHVLLTISNDAWFGDSIGPLQHFQMARMRAVEIGRYVIRGTNNGVSAIIAADGSVQQRSDQFVMANLQGHVVPMTGQTPFMFWGNGMILALILLMLAVALDTKHVKFYFFRDRTRR